MTTGLQALGEETEPATPSLPVAKKLTILKDNIGQSHALCPVVSQPPNALMVARRVPAWRLSETEREYIQMYKYVHIVCMYVCMYVHTYVHVCMYVRILILPWWPERLSPDHVMPTRPRLSLSLSLCLSICLFPLSLSPDSFRSRHKKSVEISCLVLVQCCWVLFFFFVFLVQEQSGLFCGFPMARHRSTSHPHPLPQPLFSTKPLPKPLSKTPPLPSPPLPQRDDIYSCYKYCTSIISYRLPFHGDRRLCYHTWPERRSQAPPNIKHANARRIPYDVVGKYHGEQDTDSPN